MIRVLISIILVFAGLTSPSAASPIVIDWKSNGGVNEVFAGGASISFSPIEVESFSLISTFGFWTNLVDTRFSSLEAEIRVRLNGTWKAVAYNDRVRGISGSAVNLLPSDFQNLPVDLSGGFIDGIFLNPNSVIFSGFGGLHDGTGTQFFFLPRTVHEPATHILVAFCLAILIGFFKPRRAIQVLNRE